ncbi:K(+)-transporting ATPase subunit F [Kitasatospora sp. NPDC088346]
MSVDTLVGLLVASALVGYLVLAAVYPKKF